MGRLMLFNKALIANRGEIVVRIARACSALGIKSVAIYSDADRDALHVRACDEAYYIGPAPATESYLRGDKIIEVAHRAGCDAIHPGFGFLSENAGFAADVIAAGLAWVGPSPEAIALMGSKIESKRLAEQAGVPVVPGYWGDDRSLATLESEAQRIGFPVLIKASAGGGGKGMRVVESQAGLAEALEGARREAQAAFGDDTIMLERYLEEPRHIEIQVLGDKFGHLIHLGERECSIQRRHQKVVEESPSPAVSEELREKMAASALALARAAGYYNAGTVEFIYQDGHYFFLEMNTRLQVEHAVTEEAHDFDLVEAQIRIAAGEPLALSQEDIAFVSHALEVRLYAEDPERGFLPSTGTITRLDAPHEEAGVRIDAGVGLGDRITPYYDPMIAKIITSGETRQSAIRRMREALGGLNIGGVTTNLDFLRWVVAHPQFEMGNLSTRFIERYYQPGAFALAPIQVVLSAAGLSMLGALSAGDEAPDVWQSLGWRLARQQLRANLIVAGHRYEAVLSKVTGAAGEWQAVVRQSNNIMYEGHVGFQLQPHQAADNNFDRVPPTLELKLDEGPTLYSIEYGLGETQSEFFVVWQGQEYWIRIAPGLSTDRLGRTVRHSDEDTLESPMPGKVLKVLVAAGDQVSEEEPLVIIEAMKMEFTVRAPHEGKVANVCYKEGDQVAAGDVLVEMEK